MSHPQRVQSLDIWALARSGAQIEGEQPVAELARLQSACAAQTSEPVRWRLQGLLKPGPDGQYYLFATYLYTAGQGHEIGIGRAATPFGPWQMSKVPVVRRMVGGFDDIGPIAPTVLIENGTVRMWFHGFSSVPQAQIGYAEALWPLRAP